MIEFRSITFVLHVSYTVKRKKVIGRPHGGSSTRRSCGKGIIGRPREDLLLCGGRHSPINGLARNFLQLYSPGQCQGCSQNEMRDRPVQQTSTLDLPSRHAPAPVPLTCALLTWAKRFFIARSKLFSLPASCFWLGFLLPHAVGSRRLARSPFLERDQFLGTITWELF